MNDYHPSGVLGGLPHSRPHRRSPKRAIPGAAGPKTGEEPRNAPAEVDTAPVAEAKPHSASSRMARAGSAAKSRPRSAPKARASASAQPRPNRSEGGARTAEPGRSSAQSPRFSAQSPRPSAQSRQPGAPPTTRAPEPPDRPSAVATAAQAAAELAEIGLTMSARALRGALSRLPRP